MKRIVIVDDSVIIQNELQNFFIEKMGYEVVGIGKDGNEAIALYKKFKPDLITLDITMPNKSGVEALKEILSIDPTAKVIMVSVINDADKINDCLLLGAKTYLEKPLKFNSDIEVEKYQYLIKNIVEQG
ncbi:response regulator [Candidatus Margulisiibacteriota bacterium]